MLVRRNIFDALLHINTHFAETAFSVRKSYNHEDKGQFVFLVDRKWKCKREAQKSSQSRF